MSLTKAIARLPSSTFQLLFLSHQNCQHHFSHSHHHHIINNPHSTTGHIRHLSLVPKAAKISTGNLIKTLTIRPSKSDLPGFQSLPPYLVFRYADLNDPTHTTRVVRTKNRSFNLTNFGGGAADQQQLDRGGKVKVSKRPLLLLFAWMLSEQPHIEKYREFWINRGFDILTVQTSPTALLLPGVGGRYVAGDVFKFVSQIRPRYDEILVHAFSVGGYALGEFLNHLYVQIGHGNVQAEQIIEAIKGIIMDSVVFSDDAAPGLSRAITRHPVGQPLLEKSIAAFLKLTKPFTVDRYKKLEKHIIDNERQVPSLMLFSRDDLVSNYLTNFAVVNTWDEHGITSRAKCWEKSGHVVHYKNYPKEYEQEVDDFVARLNIVKAPKRSKVNQVQLKDYGTEPFTD